MQKKNVLTQSPIMSEEKDPDISCEQGSFLLHAFRGSYYLLLFFFEKVDPITS